MERPWCCPEPRCRPVLQVADSAAGPLGTPQPGQSFGCWGRLTEDVRFEYDGVEHRNDLKSCQYTALKGVMSWQENRDDWVLMAAAYHLALSRINAEDSRG